MLHGLVSLAQVSTWFANARRRLKKENKMTWEPRNKTDDDDAKLSDDEDDEKEPGDKEDDDIKKDDKDGDATSKYLNRLAQMKFSCMALGDRGSFIIYGSMWNQEGK